MDDAGLARREVDRLLARLHVEFETEARNDDALIAIGDLLAVDDPMDRHALRQSEAIGREAGGDDIHLDRLRGRAIRRRRGSPRGGRRGGADGALAPAAQCSDDGLQIIAPAGEDQAAIDHHRAERDDDRAGGHQQTMRQRGGDERRQRAEAHHHGQRAETESQQHFRALERAAGSRRHHIHGLQRPAGDHQPVEQADDEGPMRGPGAAIDIALQRRRQREAKPPQRPEQAEHVEAEDDQKGAGATPATPRSMGVKAMKAPTRPNNAPIVV